MTNLQPGCLYQCDNSGEIFAPPERSADGNNAGQFREADTLHAYQGGVHMHIHNNSQQVAEGSLCTYEQFLDCIAEAKTKNFIKEHGMLFKTALVQAIANTSYRSPINPELPVKWQTRRIIKPCSKPRISPLELTPWLVHGEQQVDDDGNPCWEGTHPDYPTGAKWFSPPINLADRIWIKEKAKILQFSEIPRQVQLRYESDGVEAWVDYPERLKWTPQPGSYFPRGNLFREAARIILEVEDVRAERLADISREDAIAEGVHTQGCPVEAFRTLWNQINKDSDSNWDANPWVWVYEFHRIEEGC